MSTVSPEVHDAVQVNEGEEETAVCVVVRSIGLLKVIEMADEMATSEVPYAGEVETTLGGVGETPVPVENERLWEDVIALPGVESSRAVVETSREYEDDD